ncbi:MAG: GtrA family protein [Clostridia bacterium]|nr:GtrA family protein [Clostridia bacterium]
MKSSATKNIKLIEYLKATLVGAFSMLADFFVTALILYAEGAYVYGKFSNVIINSGMHQSPISIFLTANFLGTITGIIINYLLSVFFTYQYGHLGKTKTGFAKFCVLSIIGTLISTGLNYIGYALLVWNVWLVKFIVTEIVFVYNFLTRKYFIFNIKLIMDDENTIRL